MTAPARMAAALAVLAACKPIFFEVDDGPPDPATTGDPEPDTDPHPTGGPDPTDPGDPPPPADCDDGQHNGGETDVDCGGPCKPCLPGQACLGPEDCISGACELGKCNELQCHSDDECAVDTKDIQCARGVCEAGTCNLYPAFDGEPCEDFDPCTDVSFCAMGQCLGAPRSCEEFSGPCRAGFCNPQTGNCAAEFAFDGTPCEDGDICTQKDTCLQGACVGAQPAPFFSESFIMQQGWQLDPMWEIGAAMPSMCSSPELDDPAFDAGGDGFLAGTLIGQCVPPEGFDPICLTSPPIFAPDPNPLVLSFASWLSADQATATVEFFDGQGWSPLPVDLAFAGKQWFEHQVDLPPTMPELQVRFCLIQPQPVMLMSGGWSIDEVRIGPPQCAP